MVTCLRKKVLLAVVLGLVACFTPMGGFAENAFLHPADSNADWDLVMSEAISYIAGWQGGYNPISYAIRAAYLWQNGEAYSFDGTATAPLCWKQGESGEGEGEDMPVIVVGSAAGPPGSVVNVPIALKKQGKSPSTILFQVAFDPVVLSFQGVAAGPVAVNAGKTADANPPEGTLLSVAIYGGRSTPANGHLATLSFLVGAAAPGTVTVLSGTQASAADSGARLIPATVKAGAVFITAGVNPG